MNPIKCLVLSDSHGRVDLLRRAIGRQPTVDALIFLGDGLFDLEEVRSSVSPQTAIFAVRGNCDYALDYLGTSVGKLDSITLGGKKIVFTHGDLYGVKYGLDGLVRLAENTGADIVLYGHTHKPCEQYLDGVYYFNPGTVGGGLDGSSCGVLTITENGVLFSFMEL